MRIKRTFAATMREALAQVKLEQGADAVILGNKKVPGGVEILSAIDFDEEQLFAAEAMQFRQAAQASAQPVKLPLEVADDNWVGSLIDDRLNGRKEPTFGRVTAKAKAKVTEVATARQPHWFEQELNKVQRSIAVEKAKPVAKRPKPVSVKKQVQVVKAKSKPKAAVPVQASPITDKVVIDEVKLELQNLRNLMESQLSVLQWDRFSQKHPVRTVLLNLMAELGLGSDVCNSVLAHITQLNEDPHKVWQHALGIIASCMPKSREDLMAGGGRIALVGSTGVGKTTTIAKIAARFSHIHGKRSVAMISTDQFRIGAQEQLQQYARLLEIPLLTASNSTELRDCINMLSDKKLVLIDTAGASQADIRLSERFHRMQGVAPEIKPYLVMSANTQLAALNQTVLNFKKVKLAGAIVTKVDEAASLGGILTTSIRHQLALSYCGTGQKVPQDLEPAKSHRLISRAVSLMQQFSEQQDQEVLAIRYKNIINQIQA
ncbi:MAG: flagellar biosynthesis protein FlhF [Planctomycetota bacterium]|jgi:flagellar biosynthesis protein FlhF